MEYTSVDASQAVLPCPPPDCRRGSQFYLNWDSGSTYIAPLPGGAADALTSGANAVDRCDSTQIYKRRRLGGQSLLSGAPPYAITQTTYGAHDSSFDPMMLGARASATAQSADTSGDMMQTTPELGSFSHGAWDGIDQLCCGPWWPSLQTLYAPLTQTNEPVEAFEPDRDLAPASAPLVLQQYVSPDLIQIPGAKYDEPVVRGIPAPLVPSTTTELPMAAPSMSIRTEAPLINMQSTPSDLQLASTSLASQDLYTHPYHLPTQTFEIGSDCMSLLQATSGSELRDEVNRVGTAQYPGPIGPPRPNGHPILFDVVGPNCKSKRGPFKDEALRQQTAETRNQGACIECARQRIRCIPKPDDVLGPCLNCLRLLSVRMPRIPCLRYRITDVKLSKTEQVPGYEWTRRWRNTRKNIKNWASEEIKVIYISEGLSNTQMKFHVKKFVPQVGDKMDRSWVHHGSRKSAPIPPYALTRLEDAKEAYQRHIVATESGALKHVLAPTSSLFRETYELAAELRRSKDLDETSKTLLETTFQLWMVVRFSTMSTWIVGEETLGMPRNILDASPNPGKIPLPPVLGAQLDSILIHEFQENIRRKLLRQLDKAFRKYKHPNWLIMYLVSFILLHNAALITAHDAKYAQKHGMKRRFAREASVEEYHKGAMIILAHFHNCTRNHPFSDGCNESDLKDLCKMTEEQIRFVRDTRVYIKVHQREWERIREEGLYEHDCYFVSQLFQEPWKPHTFSVEPSCSGSDGSSENSMFEGSEAGSDRKE